MVGSAARRAWMPSPSCAGSPCKLLRGTTRSSAPGGDAAGSARLALQPATLHGGVDEHADDLVVVLADRLVAHVVRGLQRPFHAIRVAGRCDVPRSLAGLDPDDRQSA